MILADIHMHTDFSSDSKSPMESMIQGAIEKGLKTICFTEHLDYEYPGDDGQSLFLVDIDAYRKKLFELKDIYKNDIEILFGIEFGLLPHLADRYQQTASSYDFDFIIGSSHLVPAPWYPNDSKHGDPYDDAFWADRSVEDVCEAYFQSILDNISSYKNFDTYGHIDYIVRYAPEKNKGYTYQKYAHILDKILKALIEHDIALEVNTAGFKYGLGEPHPQSDILKRYLELGGDKITIGADGHNPEHIAYDFKKAETLLKDLGFKYYTVFKKRVPHKIAL